MFLLHFMQAGFKFLVYLKGLHIAITAFIPTPRLKKCVTLSVVIFFVTETAFCLPAELFFPFLLKR